MKINGFNPIPHNEGERTGNVFVGNTNIKQVTSMNSIDKKLSDAREKAWKIISEQFETDNRAEKNFDNIRSRQNQLKDEILNSKEALSEIDKQKEALMTEYQVSQEDLSDMSSLNKDFVDMYAELDEQTQYHADIISNAEGEIQVGTMSIISTKIEMLKHHNMGDATKIADDIMESAIKEIIGDIINEAKDHIDEDLEKAQEDGEKLQEELEKKQELIEKNQDKNRQEAAAVQEELSQVAKGSSDTTKDIEDLKQRLKLLEEDLKGIAVDDIV